MFSISSRHCTKEGLSDYQSRLNELRKLIEKLQGMKHCVSFFSNRKIYALEVTKSKYLRFQLK